MIISKVIISVYNHENLYFAVAVRKGKIVRAILPKSSHEDAVAEISKGFNSYTLSDEYRHFAKSICNIYYGKKNSIKKEDLDLSLNEFQKKILLEVMKIPKGEIKTYKQISEGINSKAYRAVGTAIGKNPLPLIIPCHRVIRSDLKVGKFFGGTKMKKEILKNEGICILNNKIKK